MSHKYTAFQFAWGAYTPNWGYCQGYYNTGFSQMQDGFTDWYVPNDHAALGHALNAIQWLLQIAKLMFDFPATAYDQSYYMESIYWAYADAPTPPPYELTWQKICEAWIKDDFAGRAMTISCIDRMRQILWDEPFYVVWAARPEQQEF